MTINLKPSDLPAWIFWALDLVVALGFAVIFVGVVLRYWGVALPLIPTADATNLAYYAGAWWLYRKARS